MMDMDITLAAVKLKTALSDFCLVLKLKPLVFMDDGWTTENLARTEQQSPDILNQLIDCAPTLTEDAFLSMYYLSYTYYRCIKAQDKLWRVTEKQLEQKTKPEEIFFIINENNDQIEELSENSKIIEEIFIDETNDKIGSDNDSTRKIHTCLDCREEFTKKSLLQAHRKICSLIGSDNSKRKGPFSCQICHKILPTLVGFSVHKTMHLRQENGIKRKSKVKEPIENKKNDLNVCYICGKTFKQSGALKLHLDFHTKTKNFECDICKKQYYTKTNLKDHLNLHSNEKKFNCITCGKAFFTNRQLRKHAIIHRNRKISCTFLGCTKKFIHPYECKMHMMVHTGCKPFSCTKCNGKFRFSWDLRKHNEKHHKIEIDTNDKEVDPIAIKVHENADNTEIYYEYL